MITHAVITAAGRGLKPYPAWDTPVKLLSPLIDRDGEAKPVLAILAEEAFSIGVREVVVVVAPGDEEEYRHGLSTLARTFAASGETARERRITEMTARLHFAVQEQPTGLGHAVWSVRSRVEGNRFLLMLCDHLFLSGTERTGAQQMLAAVADPGAAVSAVVPVYEHRLRHYGIVGASRVPGADDVWRIERVIEKPSPTQAERELEAPGLGAGRYLAFAGSHILPTSVFAQLERDIAGADGGRVELSVALDRLAHEGRYFGVRCQGTRQDIGVPYGLFEAQLERSLRGVDRDRVLARLLQIVAASQGETPR